MGRLGLVWAQSRDGWIGADGGMPWHVPEDLAHFRRLTLGSPVIMGRATWDALPDRSRPLPGRENLVLSRRPDLELDGARVVGSVEAALEAVGDRDAWGIGGAQVLEALLPAADVLVVTDLDLDVAGDTPAPALDATWCTVRCEPASGWARSVGGVRYRIRTLRHAG
ncbi:dihydrofolate reductase [Cellulomonas carbonis]|uniref:Dihydrofolate reductase n=1 Tax=Cellulomonas carbonis T26 TaxID=947969 RepID=A0A0A0BUT9_9CELL|nr:dihydrofolate reductase [Cellulomonas carbonis]KGM12163.1 dihydrofolate reductase [Cellulomonas carbonis T26]GGB97553.1 dihydrofolate reductase [Cellulomonas carbonis]